MKVDRLPLKMGSLAGGLVVGSLVLVCMAVTVYCHFVLHLDVVFTHLCYIPIVLAGIWWGMSALGVAAVLGSWLIVSHWLSGASSSYATEFLRFFMFLVIAALVGFLSREFKRSENELRDARDFLQSLVNSSQVPIAVWNDCGIVTMFNQALGELTGYTRGQMLGQPIKALFPDRFYEELRAALARSDAVPVEVPIRRSDGQQAICLWSPAVILARDGRTPAAWMVQGIDITKRKWAEDIMTRHAAELERLNQRLVTSEGRLAELNSAKDKFFSIISHDLRSPFMPILLYSEMLEKEHDTLEPGRAREFAGAIHANARRLYGLVENLLEWSSIQTGRMDHQPTMIDVEDLARSNIALLRDSAAAKAIRLLMEVPPGTKAWGDRYQINCVLQNLISNGIKFTSSGGEVRVKASPRDGRTVVTVIDNGVGMNDEAIRSVFRIDTYHTTLGTRKEKGSGLGLILCQELLKLNESTLEVISSQGKGSSFTFALPTEKL